MTIILSTVTAAAEKWLQELRYFIYLIYFLNSFSPDGSGSVIDSELQPVLAVIAAVL